MRGSLRASRSLCSSLSLWCEQNQSHGEVEKSSPKKILSSWSFLVPSPIPPHLIVSPKKSLKLTRKREQVKRRGSVSQAGISEAVISKAPNSSTGCVTEGSRWGKFSLVRFGLMCRKMWVEDSFSSSWRGYYPGCFIATLISWCSSPLLLLIVSSEVVLRCPFAKECKCAARYVFGTVWTALNL